jgi:predicted dehydrogenase
MLMQTNENKNSRRDFLKKSGAIAAGTALTGVLTSGLTPRVHAAEDNTINVALVGCGGRGNGAIRQALSTKGPTKVVAFADAFEFKVKNARQSLLDDDHFKAKVDVPDDRLFSGMDAYKNAIDAVGPGGVILLCTPPAFRPIQFEYAVEKGVNAFIEKSFAVDAPGIKRVIAAAKKASEKNLKVVTGLMSRHSVRLQECIKRIHDGAIGDIISSWVYRVHGPFGVGDKGDWTPLQHQLLNFNCFNWLCGSFVLDWMIHNIDVSSWAKNDEWPVSVQGQGGRQVRQDKDQMFDHVALEYRYADGKQMFLQLRQIANTWSFFGTVLHGTKGSAELGEGIGTPKIFKGYKRAKENEVWVGNMPEIDKYQYEHDTLFKAIREDIPWNEAERGCQAAFTGIIGRMAAESGKEIFREEAYASDQEMTPGIEKLDFNGDSPYMPNANGDYEIARPGTTKPK